MTVEMTSMDGTALEVRGVSFGYPGGPLVLDDFSLTIAPGEVCCLLGPSGCGKSTLLRLIAGLERPTAGEIQLGGETVVAPGRWTPPERRHVGMVFQDLALFPNLSVRRNVQFGVPRGSTGSRRAIAERELERVQMDEYAARMPHTLSGGQQQRVALARAMARDPRVMLLDEPFCSLDDGLHACVRCELIDIVRARGVATLLVTHDERDADAVADQVIQLAEPRPMPPCRAVRATVEGRAPVAV